MQPEFGSDVFRYVFAPIDAGTRTNLAEAVRRAIQVWERRVRNLEVEVGASPHEEGRLEVEISFDVETHRMRQSLVYPFYLEQPEIPR